MNNITLMTQSIAVHEKAEELTYHFDNGTLLTYAEWKKRGFQVVKGQKASFKCQIWNRTKNKKYKEGNGEKEYIYFKKVASFFTLDQVKEI